jgi:flagellar protein FliS
MTDPRSAYREASAQGISPVETVLRLYEQIIEDLRQASLAIESRQIELRTNRINHAILVVGHLQSRLNFETGENVARNLDRFYNILRRDLLQAQFQASTETLSSRIEDLLGLREAWIEVERSQNRASANSTSSIVPSSAEATRADWIG